MTPPSSLVPGITIREAAAQIRGGQLTAVGLAERCLETIRQQDGQLHAYITVLEDQALRDAQTADRELARKQDRGPLHGIPVSVKDLIDLRGVPTTAASRVRPTDPATNDAPVLGRLREAGAIFVGKCNLHEFAFGTTGEVSAYGPTRHPTAPNRLAGGSSSGSAVSIATGMALASIGTDTGGSIRIPAAACGVVGLKPRYGEVSCEGVVALAPSLDHVGPLGQTVEDVAIVYRAMGHFPQPQGRTPGAVAPLRLGLLRTYFLEVMDPSVRSVFDDAVVQLKSAGCEIELVDLPGTDRIAHTYRHTVLYEALREHRHTLDTRPDDYAPSVRERLEQGRSVSPAMYSRAQDIRAELTAAVTAALQRHDALLLPTLPIPAPARGSDTVVLDGTTHDVRSLTLRLTQLFDLTGHPAISLPCGITDDGLPCGAQLVGMRTTELLEVAATAESILSGRRATARA